MRWLILLHRYVGIGVGWLLVVWCLSGIVMMYVLYPDLTDEEHIDALPRLDLGACCRFSPPYGADRDEPVSGFAVQMLGDRPVLRATDLFGRPITLDLTTGHPIEQVSADRAARILARMNPPRSTRGTAEFLGTIERDQWTVTGYFDGDRPLHRFALGDAAGTHWYLSARSGDLVQDATRTERFWGWLGSVPHWLYPTLLRQNGPLWIQVVIWSTVVGLFLTVVGIYIGIARLRRRRSGRWSPYRGVAWWHHVLGLVFGLLTLTWLASGLLSVNPWGLLEGAGASTETRNLRGMTMTWRDVEKWLDDLPGARLPAGTTRVEAAPLAGSAYLLALGRGGSQTRLAADTMMPAPLDADALREAARAMLPDRSIASAQLIHEDDAFYFTHHLDRPLPVFRVVTRGPDATRYYLDADSGRLVGKADPSRQWYRWLHQGAHRLDFTAALRSRPVWDILMLALLGGVTALCATGTYMGIRYVLR